MKVVGLAWLVVALAFVPAVAGVLMRAEWWPSVACATIAASIVLGLMGWPDARLGLLANTVIGVFIVMGRRLGWF